MSSKEAATVVNVWVRAVAVEVVRHGPILDVSKEELKGLADWKCHVSDRNNRKKGRAIIGMDEQFWG